MPDKLPFGGTENSLKLDYSNSLSQPLYKSSAFVNYNNPTEKDLTSIGNELFKNASYNKFKGNSKSMDLLGGIGAKKVLGDETPWYKDNNAMQGYAGLASAFAQLATLPGQLELASLQRKGLKQNIKQAEENNALQKTARSNLSKSMFA